MNIFKEFICQIFHRKFHRNLNPDRKFTLFGEVEYHCDLCGREWESIE